MHSHSRISRVIFSGHSIDSKGQKQLQSGSKTSKLGFGHVISQIWLGPEGSSDV